MNVPIRNPIEMAARIWRREGFFAFYNGLSAALLRQLIYGTARLGLYRHIADSWSAHDAATASASASNSSSSSSSSGGDAKQQQQRPESLALWKRCVAGLAAGGVDVVAIGVT